ncbi:hypothetical protein CHLRE_13g606500v5 [Chlamydomonas reinhardtii]|uniref:CHCH domain-containing protein n=1 Tax=Chlamydomonas reinhardtii TaxID=3055 RepID=A0A2K3D1G4_CHLRE|nr:uncharacterized protein CHLRE_13g606500v5 [Chlamydomonas reinhardtii]PNW74388.1 hypothetical protein CHLRE_13g606500v5 [Chlamydomonas reinhardtii]
MGHDMDNIREVDVNGVAKRLVTADAPCGQELGQLLDCMKRAGPEGDSVCAKERSALAACAGRQARMPRNTAQEKRQVVRQLQTLVSAWKRFGY